MKITTIVNKVKDGDSNPFHNNVLMADVLHYNTNTCKGNDYIIYPCINENSKTISLLTSEDFVDVSNEANNIKDNVTVVNNVIYGCYTYNKKCIKINVKIIFNPYRNNFCLLIACKVGAKKKFKYIFIHNIEANMLFSKNRPVEKHILIQNRMIITNDNLSVTSVIASIVSLLFSSQDLFENLYSKDTFVLFNAKILLHEIIYDYMEQINIHAITTKEI